jgi:hypothetical protein
MVLFLTKRDAFVLIIILPDLFLPAFHLKRNESVFNLLLRLRLLKKK